MLIEKKCKTCKYGEREYFGKSMAIACSKLAGRICALDGDGDYKYWEISEEAFLSVKKEFIKEGEMTI